MFSSSTSRIISWSIQSWPLGPDMVTQHRCILELCSLGTMEMTIQFNTMVVCVDVARDMKLSQSIGLGFRTSAFYVEREVGLDSNGNKYRMIIGF